MPLTQRRQFLRHAMRLGATLPLFALGACSPSSALQQHSAQIPIFGTLVDILLYAPSKAQALAAIAAVEQRFEQFHREWHAWEKGGIVSKLNRAIANQQSIQVAPSIITFIQKSQQLCRDSQHLFDPGIGQLIALWGFHGEHWQGPPPSDSAIEGWLKTRPSILDLEISGNLISSRNPKVQLDFGGNAKGLALDIALQVLQHHQIAHALVSIGGDMKSLGAKPDGRGWKVGIQSPQNPQQPVASIELKANEAVVTSGTYQRYFEWQGQRFSHILNPNTGRPAHGFASVTVLDEDATKADSAATALLIAGVDHWEEIAQSMQVNKVFCIEYNGQILQTKTMANRSKLL